MRSCWRSGLAQRTPGTITPISHLTIEWRQRTPQSTVSPLTDIRAWGSAHPADSKARSPQAGDDLAGLAGLEAWQEVVELDDELNDSIERAIVQCTVQHPILLALDVQLDDVKLVDTAQLKCAWQREAAYRNAL